jgi:hypothetical protein
LPHAAGHDRSGEPIKLGVEPEILLGAQILVDRRFLKDQAKTAPDLVALRDDIVVPNASNSRARLHERTEDLDRSRLASTIRSEKPKRFASANIEVDAAQRLDLAVALREPAYADCDGRIDAGTSTIAIDDGIHATQYPFGSREASKAA